MENYDMNCKCIKKNVHITGRSRASNDIILQHMANHYNRILNAKKVVDTSPPYCFKKKKVSYRTAAPSLTTKASKTKQTAFYGRNISPALTERSVSSISYKDSCCTAHCINSSRYHVGCVEESQNSQQRYALNKALIDKITFDTKRKPTDYCEENWVHFKTDDRHEAYKKSFGENKNKVNNHCYQVDNLKEKCQCMDNESKQKANLKNPPELPLEHETEIVNCKCRKICVCDLSEGGFDYKKNSVQSKEQSQTSSRDSAYNGGVSSLPESRSPTPDEKRKKGCCCAEQKKQNSVKFCKSKQVLSSSKDPKLIGVPPEKEMLPEERPNFLTPHRPVAEAKCQPLNDEALTKMKQDALYIQFVQDITVEILEKCLYTNKALKKVMKKHIIQNMNKLDKSRMLKEVDTLRLQLGIPEDKSLFDLDDVATESFTDLLSAYPIISDSEFVPPGVRKRNEETFKHRGTPTESGRMTSGESTPTERSVKRCEPEKPGKAVFAAKSDDEDDERVPVVAPAKEKGNEQSPGRNSLSEASVSRSVSKVRAKEAESGRSSSLSSEIEEKIAEDFAEEDAEENEDRKKRGGDNFFSDLRDDDSVDEEIVEEESRNKSFWSRDDSSMDDPSHVNVGEEGTNKRNKNGKTNE